MDQYDKAEGQEIGPHICSALILDIVVKGKLRGKHPLQPVVLETLYICIKSTHTKKILHKEQTFFTRIYTWWTIDLSTKWKTIKLIKVNTDEYADISITKDLIHERMIDNIAVFKAKLLGKPLSGVKTTRHSTQNAFRKNAVCKVLW